MKRVLFDSDVLLDVLLERQPFFRTSAQDLDLVAQGKVEGYIAVAYSAANAEKLEAIITRNIKDFRLGTIPAIQPDIFITRQS